jgi:POT family proton-dependent oligopeptide transporter
VVSVLTAIIFWFTFHHYDDQEEEMNTLEERPTDEKQLD